MLDQLYLYREEFDRLVAQGHHDNVRTAYRFTIKRSTHIRGTNPRQLRVEWDPVIFVDIARDEIEAWLHNWHPIDNIEEIGIVADGTTHIRVWFCDTVESDDTIRVEGNIAHGSQHFRAPSGSAELKTLSEVDAEEAEEAAEIEAQADAEVANF